MIIPNILASICWCNPRTNHQPKEVLSTAQLVERLCKLLNSRTHSEFHLFGKSHVLIGPGFQWEYRLLQTLLTFWDWLLCAERCVCVFVYCVYIYISYKNQTIYVDICVQIDVHVKYIGYIYITVDRYNLHRILELYYEHTQWYISSNDTMI